jgi:hypothetical protein
MVECGRDLSVGFIGATSTINLSDVSVISCGEKYGATFLETLSLLFYVLY